MSDQAVKQRIDFETLDAAQRYFFMISAIVPRPIAWVSTRAADGTTNLAPFSFFQGVCASPPTLMISVAAKKSTGERKDTLSIIEETGEFVVNVVSEELAEPMVASALELPSGKSEIDAGGIETFPGERVAAPCVAIAPVSLECRLSHELPIGDCVALFGEILLAHVREDLLDARGTIDPDKLRPLGRLGGSLYQPYRDAIRMKRPG